MIANLLSSFARWIRGEGNCLVTPNPHEDVHGGNMTEPDTPPGHIQASELYSDYVSNDDRSGADDRAQARRDDDPFDTLPPALLSSEHIQAYVKQTAMLHPFHPDSGRLKPASYEVRPGKYLIFWDEHGRKVTDQISPGRTYTLHANSITFLQIESRISLPNYIAARFNLRITHVHRGLLLGTGPLIDPGFHGDLLIPVHNLTSDDYEISSDEGLIWIEFTKTSRDYLEVPKGDKRFKALEQHKTDRAPEYYFEKASKNNPIQSSIPKAIIRSREISVRSEKAARDAKRTNQIFAGLGIVAIVGTVIGLFSFFEAVKGNVNSAVTLASTVNGVAVGAAADAKTASEATKDLKSQVDKIVEENRQLRNDLDRANLEIDQLHKREFPSAK